MLAWGIGGLAKVFAKGGIEEVLHKGGLSRARDAGEADQVLEWNLHIDVLEIVRPGPANDEPVGRANRVGAGRVVCGDGLLTTQVLAGECL